MSRTPARVNQAEVTRSIRAMINAGFAHVRVVLCPNGTVLIEPSELQTTIQALDSEREIVL